MGFHDWLVSELSANGILEEDFDDVLTKDSLEDEYDISSEEFDDFKSAYIEYCESMQLTPELDIEE